METYACFDIGGSAIKVAVITETGEMIDKTMISVATSFDLMIESLVTTYKELKEKHGVSGIAISAPGAVDDKTGIIHGDSAIPYIHGPNWKEIFKDKLGLNISIENDANCAALGELYFGGGKQYKDIVYVVIGTGIGGAVVVEHQLLKGEHQHGGEFGHMIMERNPVRTWSELGAVGGLLYRAAKDGKAINNGRELFEQAQNDDYYQTLVKQFYEVNAWGIYNIQYTLDPQVVLIGGAISQRPDLIEHIERAMDDVMEATQTELRPNIAVGILKDDANLFGALAHYLVEYNG